MNVGVDIRCLMDKDRTGVGEYTFGLLDNLFKIDKENQFFLFYNSNKDIRDNLPKWDYENVHYVGTKYPNKLLNLFLFFKILKLDNLVLCHLERNDERKRGMKSKDPMFILKKPGDPSTSSSYAKAAEDYAQDDVVDIWFSPNLNFTNLSKHIKHIQTIHDLSFEFFPEYFTGKQRLWHWFLNPKKQCEKADIILTPSENTRRDVEEEFGVPSSKFRVLRPGLSLDYGLWTVDYSEKIKQKYNLPKKYILYLGTLEPRKNVDTIIEAYKMNYELGIRNYDLVIAGGSGWKNKKLMKLIKDTKGVKYIGYVNEEEKVALYKNASIFVFPSFYEGFGLPVLEAMACGVPVITSNRSSLMEVGQDAICYVNPYNVSELTGAMNNVLNNNVLVDIMTKEGLKIFQKFNWDKVVEEFMKLL